MEKNSITKKLKLTGPDEQRSDSIFQRELDRINKKAPEREVNPTDIKMIENIHQLLTENNFLVQIGSVLGSPGLRYISKKYISSPEGLVGDYEFSIDLDFIFNFNQVTMVGTSRAMGVKLELRKHSNMKTGTALDDENHAIIALLEKNFNLTLITDDEYKVYKITPKIEAAAVDTTPTREQVGAAMAEHPQERKIDPSEADGVTGWTIN